MDLQLPWRKKEIQVLGIRSTFASESGLIERVRQELSKLQGKPAILVFPEAVISSEAIEGARAKKLAEAIHELLKKHGNAFVAYSVFEKRGRFTTNSGYLIKPSGQRYQVYPKVTTKNNGKILTDFDAGMLERNTANAERARREVFGLAQKVNAFPMITINGRKVEMRVCADVTHDNESDNHPAKRVKRELDLMVVPAVGLGLGRPESLEHLKERLGKKGMAVIVDHDIGVRVLHGNSLNKTVIRESDVLRKRRFAIHHKL